MIGSEGGARGQNPGADVTEDLLGSSVGHGWEEGN